uniref:MAM and LDL receptor class A domain containing 1 n=1 Tax=Leptobrachium leishanense TaxID=445787 RepID=A0A8C5MKX6_9ANUR
MFNSSGLFALLITINLLKIVLTSQGNGFQCRNGFFAPSDNLCDFTDQCGDNSDESQCSLYEKCDFETDLCNMTSEGWIRTNGFTSRSPQHDHTLKDSAYFLALSSPSMLPAQAVLRSVVFSSTDERNTCQLRFYYHFADVSGSLMIGLQMYPQDQVNDVWKQTSSQKNVWTREVITIHSSEKFKVSQHVQSWYGDDDEVSLCDSDMCDWTPRSPEGHVSWILESSLENLASEFASKISRNGKGRNNNSSCHLLNLMSKILERNYNFFQGNQNTYSLSQDNFYLLSFVFEGRIGDSRGFIALEDVRVVGSAKPLKSARESCLNAQSACDFEEDCSDGIDEDPAYCSELIRIINILRVVQRDPNGCRKIILEATLFSSNSTVAVDDISFSPECILSNITDSAAKCDFENHTCGWHERFYDHSFDWIRGSSSIISSDYQDQAPPQDHTINKVEGHFMFVRKRDHLNTQIAELRSPRFRQAASGCTMTFWYYNYGLSVGKAEMHLHVDSEKVPTLVWNTYYDQGNQWLKAFVQLDRLSQPFQLSLTKRNLENYNGVSAIDDVVFENCSLSPPVATCEGPDLFWCTDTKACISSISVCDLIDDCGDLSDESDCPPELQCNFEDGLCNWVQDIEDDFDWTMIQGSTPTLDTGPMKDHTFGTAKGHFFYIETSEPQLFRNQAVLLSPIIDSTINNGNKTCIFRFFYHMYGKQIYSLVIHKRIMRNSRGQLLWQVFGNKGNRWLKKVLYINSTQPFQIMVTGTVGDGFTGDIAIDDFSFYNCTLYTGTLPTWAPAPVETTTIPTLPIHNCTTEEFVCRTTGQCIQIADKCNFRADCSDNSDEDECVSEYCNFEDKSKCQWFQPGIAVSSKSATFQWEIGQGSTIHPGEETHRPLKDRTMSSKEGTYLYADSSNGEFGDIAELMTPIISHTGPKCKLVFWSYMNGATVGIFKVLIKFRNLTYELWSQNGRQGAQWKRAEVFLGTLSSFQIVLQAIRGVSYVGDVTVDDISFENCAPIMIPEKDCTPEEFMCANKYCIPKNNLCDFVNDCADHSDENPLICGSSFSRCNFEFDLCDWKQDENDDFDWNLRAGSTPSIGTGPATDHTLQNPFGYYVFIESSFPQLPRQRAKLSGPLISRWSKGCKLIFYFHMYGGGIGLLTVSQVTIRNQEHTLLNLTGDQGNYWQREELTLLDLGEHFYVTFEARIGKDQRGDIALDDIIFSNECLPSISLTFDSRRRPGTGSCRQGYLPCNNKKCYQAEQQCDFSDDCGDFTDESECGTSCTFEDGICGWQNSKADSFDWILGNAAPALRPPYDHTTGTEDGHFLYLETSLAGLKGEKAHIKSSRWKESNANCKLRFWYYRSSKATGLIQVLIKTNKGLTKIWGEGGNPQGTWTKAEIRLGKRRDFEIVFEGIRTRDFGGGAAIDDIEFISCSTVGEKPGRCPADTDFVCKNKKCIKYHHVCDYKPDCEDQSDEMNCGNYNALSGSCDFEHFDQNGNLACDLKQDESNHFDWTIRSRIIKGINGDRNPDRGKYFLYANTSMQQEGDTARIVTTNPFPATQEQCRVRFWYYVNGSPRSGILKVHLANTHGLDILLWSKTESKMKKWLYANVILSSPSPFRVVFEAEVGSDKMADIAIDDISFTPECYFEGSPTPHPTCPPESFLCFYEKNCVPLSANCNGTEECMDGSDEINCLTAAPITVTTRRCNETEIQCADKKCIPSMLWCDGVSDCPLDEDEAECSGQTCMDGSLLCVSSDTCIPVHHRCDGTPDCSDFYQDESSCSGTGHEMIYCNQE